LSSCPHQFPGFLAARFVGSVLRPSLHHRRPRSHWPTAPVAAPTWRAGGRGVQLRNAPPAPRRGDGGAARASGGVLVPHRPPRPDRAMGTARRRTDIGAASPNRVPRRRPRSAGASQLDNPGSASGPRSLDGHWLVARLGPPARTALGSADCSCDAAFWRRGAGRRGRPGGLGRVCRGTGPEHCRLTG
jgi:hypothetical protein